MEPQEEGASQICLVKAVAVGSSNVTICYLFIFHVVCFLVLALLSVSWSKTSQMPAVFRRG